MYSDLARMGLGGKRVIECKRGTAFLNHIKQPLFITHFLPLVWLGFFVGFGGFVAVLWG